MQGSKTPLIVVVAAVALSIGGCTVHNYPQPPSPAEVERQQRQQRLQEATPPPQASAMPSEKVAPAPATRTSGAAPAPVETQQQQQKPASAPQPAPGGRSYTVKPGDNLWNIAKDVYGDGTKYQRILDANPGLNPDNMKPGTKIVIP